MRRNISIQKLAKEAKNRMNSGYKSKFPSDDGETLPIILPIISNSASFCDVTDCYQVFELMQQEDILCPLSKLIDREYFDTLDEISKQRYIFRLSAAYIGLTEQLKIKKHV